MNKEKLMDLVNTDFNKFQLEIKRFYKEEYVVSLEQQCKKQKEVIDKIKKLIKQYGKYDGQKCTRGFSMMSADFNKLLEILKEVE